MTALGDLSDVDTTDATNQDRLTYDGSSGFWVARAPTATYVKISDSTTTGLVVDAPVALLASSAST